MCPQFTQLFAVDYDDENHDNDADRDHHGGHDDDDKDDNEWK